MQYILAIAASDNSGGAGIQKDIRVICDFSLWPLTALTGITVQNFSKVFDVKPVNNTLLYKQIHTCIDNFTISSIKIGALCSEKNLDTIIQIIALNQKIPIVLDPVFISSSGRWLLPKKCIDIMKNKLFPLVSVVTPNKQELELLVNKKINTLDEAIQEALILSEQFDTAVFIKGAHFGEGLIYEALVSKNQATKFSHPRYNFTQTHGTGCTFSTALACSLALGYDYHNAIDKATNYLVNFFIKLNC